MHYAEFIATDDQLREIACSAIEASGFDRPNPKMIGLYSTGDFVVYIHKWEGKTIDLRISGVKGSIYSMMHGDFNPHRNRPWCKKFSSAVQLLLSVEGIIIVNQMTMEQWTARIAERSYRDRSSPSRRRGESLTE